MERVNHLAVIVAAIAYFVWGAVWYTVLGGAWLAAIGKTKEQMMAGGVSPMPYVVSLIVAFIVAYGIAIALARREDEQTMQLGMSFAAFVSILFVSSNMLMDFMYEQKPIALWFIDAGYIVTGMVMAGAIVGAWKKKAAVAAA